MDKVNLLQFETATTCTSNCTFCNHKHMTPRKQMPLSQIIDLCYNLAYRADTICPFGIQEPFLDSRMDKICSNVKIFNPKSTVTTYTTFPVYPKKQLENIVKWGLIDELIVSYYGGNKQVHDTLQPGLDYKQTANNIKRFMRLKQRLQYDTPQVTLGYLLTKETLPHVKAFKKQWQNKVDKLIFFRYDGWCGTQPYDLEWEEKLWGKSPERYPCENLYCQQFIHSNGDVVSCCLDYKAENKVGNVFNDWNTWWTSPKMNELRSLHEQGRWDENSLCKDCTKWRYNHKPGWNEYWKTHKTLPVASAINL